MTQHEQDRVKIAKAKRNFDDMSSYKVIIALMWRERTFISVMCNAITVVYFITHHF